MGIEPTQARVSSVQFGALTCARAELTRSRQEKKAWIEMSIAQRLVLAVRNTRASTSSVGYHIDSELYGARGFVCFGTMWD